MIVWCYTHALTHALSLTHTHTHSHTRSLSHTPTTYTHTHTHAQIRVHHAQAHTHTHSWKVLLSRSQLFYYCQFSSTRYVDLLPSLTQPADERESVCACVWMRVHVVRVCECFVVKLHEKERGREMSVCLCLYGMELERKRPIWFLLPKSSLTWAAAAALFECNL